MRRKQRESILLGCSCGINKQLRLDGQAGVDGHPSLVDGHGFLKWKETSSDASGRRNVTGCQNDSFITIEFRGTLTHTSPHSLAPHRLGF